MTHSRVGHVLAVIPARLGSERLPRKPLYPLAGRPLVEWVWRRVTRIDLLTRAVVATDSEEIAEACRAFGAPVELTSSGHASGTDRVAEVAARPAYAGADVIVNVQGDEPFVSEEAVVRSAELVLDGWDVGTVAAPVGSVESWRDAGVVKVVRGDDGAALYFTRAPVPHFRGGEPDAEQLGGQDYLRHVGVYAYAPDALRRWVALPEGRLERLERLEQLRPLAAGLQIGVERIEPIEGGVDTEADARRAEARLIASENIELGTEFPRTW